jgi:hypothetical protein
MVYLKQQTQENLKIHIQDKLPALTVIDTSNNTKVGEYHNKEDILAAVDKYKQERKSRAKILVIHLPTFYNFTDYFTGIR